MKRLTPFLLALILLVSCSSTGNNPQKALPWWRTTTFYEIFVRSFNDSNGDGIGDFNGITQKLDYLQSLGVTGLWLMPIQPSPSYHGYDITDYYAVNPQYGTMQEFKTLLQESHKRGIKVLIDLVLNHTSDQHPWFVEANTNKASRYRDWYVWSDTGGKNWHEGKFGNYFGFFWGGMPDLNYRNADVSTQMTTMTLWWLREVGVDGFRIDAVKHLIEEGEKTENTLATHQWLRGFHTAYKADFPKAYTVGEVYGAGGSLIKAYKEQVDQLFNFEVANGIVNSVSGGSNTGIYSGLRLTLKDAPDGDYAIFLTNHDQNRAMSVFNGDVDKAKAAAAMLFTSAGTPFIYYGEEIGMTGTKPDEYIRTPMQWSSAANAGFTTGTPWEAVNKGYDQGVNVEDQDKDTHSLLNHYRALSSLRQKHSALQNGAVSLLSSNQNGVYAILRSDETETILILVNLKKETLTDFHIKDEKAVLTKTDYSTETLFGESQNIKISIKEGELTGVSALAPYEVLVLLLK